MTDQVTPDMLESYLTEYGWTFTPVAEGAWLTGFQGDDRMYPLAIKLTSTCVSFEIKPLVELEVGQKRSSALMRDLLELNHKMQVVKLGLTEKGELSLSCQVLSHGFDFEALVRALGILAYYADELSDDLHARIDETQRRDPQPRLLS